MNNDKKPSPGFFTFSELGLLSLFAILAVLCELYVPVYVLLGGSTSHFVYDFLRLPGPGAGTFIIGGILCFWLILALLFIKKPWTAIVLSLLIIAINLLIAQQLNFATLDVMLFVALIIEALCLLPVETKPWSYVLPGILVISGLITLVLLFTGNAKIGEAGMMGSGLPIGYALFGILSLGLAVICYYYPVKYLFASGIANVYYLLHFWMFWGESGIGSRFPVSPDIIPVLLLVALSGGIISALFACVIDRIYNRCKEKGLHLRKE